MPYNSPSGLCNADKCERDEIYVNTEMASMAQTRSTLFTSDDAAKIDNK